MASLKKRPRIVLISLPNYAPKLYSGADWRWLRAVVTHNHYFGFLDAANAATKRFFAKAGRAAWSRAAAHRPDWPPVGASQALRELR